MNLKKLNFLPAIAILFLPGCKNSVPEGSIEQWKNEIVQAEKDFAQMAADSGISKAFLAFSAEDAVMERNDVIIAGREEFEKLFNAQPPGPEDEELSWAPDFVDVSACGDLGYTFGKYTYSYTDSTGKLVENKGNFHTVWKRQEDGSWKFVWD